MSRRASSCVLLVGVCLVLFAWWRLHVQVHSYSGCVFIDPECGTSTGSQTDWVAAAWMWGLVLAVLLVIVGLVDLVLATYFGRRAGVHEQSRKCT